MSSSSTNSSDSLASAGLGGAQASGVAPLAAELLEHGYRQPEMAPFLTVALRSLLSATQGAYAAVAAPQAGRWTVLGDSGASVPLPVDLLAEALDADRPQSRGPWSVAPLHPTVPLHPTAPPQGEARSEVLAVCSATSPVPAAAREAVESLAPVLGLVLKNLRQRDREAARTRRLEAILDIASRWYRTREMAPLLVEMAQAATRLLGADRASIFLWDKPNHTLVGRPALGVPEGELRIPDDAGVVGQVIRTGESRRVDLDRDQSLINRRVDASLGYQTRTLLCVPMRGNKGELLGAFEMINKLEGNFTDDDEIALVELAAHAAIALENTQERAKLLETRRRITEQAAQGVQLIGQSAAIETLRATIHRVAGTELAVLVLGENGTGKEVVSQSIHYLSPRRDQPFIAVNCAALAETLLESELFGHEKGAFTDAHEARPGKFELASGGTLFLDEIGDLSASGQAKLLRVLEEKVVVRVGGSKSIHTDARVIAATNQNLAEMVGQKKFRQDLYFRLNVVTLTLPPLRERVEDVFLLAEHFLKDFCAKARRTPPKFSAAARKRLEMHVWPGNIRELRNLMERIAYLATADRIDAEDLTFILAPSGSQPTGIASGQHLSEATDQFQMDYIREAVQRASGNMSQAAEQLGLHRSNLYRKMRQLGMDVDE